MVENKYDRFFESVKEFVKNTELSFENEIGGASETIINKFEQEFNIKFPSSLYAFLILFGEKIKIRKTDDIFNISLSDIRNATLTAQKENYKQILFREKGFEDYNGNTSDNKAYFYKTMDVNNVIFISQNDRWANIGFIDSSIENPIINYLYDKEYYSTEGMSFTNFIRNHLFEAIKYTFNTNSLNNEKLSKVTDGSKQWLIEVKKIKIGTLSWVQPYINNDIFYRPEYEYRKRRLEFYEITNKKEEETGIIMTIDEFEWAFIEHLRGLGVDI